VIPPRWPKITESTDDESVILDEDEDEDGQGEPDTKITESTDDAPVILDEERVTRRPPKAEYKPVIRPPKEYKPVPRAVKEYKPVPTPIKRRRLRYGCKGEPGCRKPIFNAELCVVHYDRRQRQRARCKRT
jgi:hypothetical protein